MTETKTAIVTISMTLEELNKIDMAANSVNRTRSNFLVYSGIQAAKKVAQ